ncbi:hypothetical protein [Inconstantimicrobium mannanitabidum]|uniref:Uncharacterized protein n=1 Tax=Inconstantimicrobium mannanitabidum TaxID=1604901 RepID=A0ACB5RDN0_9CLOT|nr:hypothetical protein [Clostridium sp. TW13]GKX66902.1 hypothetical protein rsdtw13_21600 [Clostridium sp. TW13]
MSENDNIKFDEACKLLNVTRYMLIKIAKEHDLEMKIIYENKHKKFLVDKSKIEELVCLQKQFWMQHYTYTFCENKFQSQLYRLKAIKIPRYAKKLQFSSMKANAKDCNYAFAKKEVDYLISQVYRKTDIKINNDYILEHEFMKMLGINKELFNLFIKEYKLECIGIENNRYFLKRDLEFYKERQKQIEDTYITASMAREKYGEKVNDTLWHKCKDKFIVPCYCRQLNGGISFQEYIYREDEVEYYENIKKFYNTVGNNDFETVKLRLNLCIDRLNIFEKTTYTKEKWYDFISEKLIKAKNNSAQSRDLMISIFVRATLDLEELMFRSNVNEVYLVNTSHIKMWFKQVTNMRKREYLYQFLGRVSEDIKLKCEDIKILCKGFKFDKIEKGKVDNNKKAKKDNSESIYSCDIYFKVFIHLTDIKLHTRRTIDCINENKDGVEYLSVWLYTLLHLNNGWRHGDITKFPRIYFKDLLDEYNIDNINWFYSNSISCDKSRRIIARIVQYDFRMSKTDIYGHFFCSDRLAPAIATAILMLEYIYNYMLIGIFPKLDDPIMQFKMSKYNEPGEVLIEKCFRGCQINNFKFSSMKMNRTVLTLIYNTACEISPSGYNALILPKYLRAHIEDMSTIQYIQFTPSQLEFLSEELFERGEFGFITDALLNIVSHKPQKSIDRTKEIKIINNLLGDKQKQEAIGAMLNHFKDEKEEIVQLLNEMSYEECLKVLSKIYMSNLPSRKLDIQCLFSEQGCQFTEGNCEICKYSIPSIYVLKTLCNTLKEEMNLYINTDSIGNKLKLSGKIHRKIDIIMEAIEKYGREYVYNSIDMTRNEFRSLFSRICEVEDLIKLM